MPIRDDDDLDVLEGLSASRDDAPTGAAPKQRSAQQTGNQQQTARRAVPSEQPPAGSGVAQGAAQGTAQPAPKSGKGLLILLFLLLLMVIGAGVWLGQQVLQLQSQQAASSNALQLERSRVESISAQVHETGSSFVETGNVLESKFKFFESEIRKLWDVSNKRNRKAIEDNKAQLAKTDKALQGKLKAVEGKIAAANKATAKLNQQLVSENTALRATIEAQNEQLLIMEGEMELLQRRIKNLPSDLTARVADNEDAVKSIDASRQQLFKRLAQVQQELDALRSPAAP